MKELLLDLNTKPIEKYFIENPLGTNMLMQLDTPMCVAASIINYMTLNELIVPNDLMHFYMYDIHEELGGVVYQGIPKDRLKRVNKLKNNIVLLPNRYPVCINKYINKIDKGILLIVDNNKFTKCIKRSFSSPNLHAVLCYKMDNKYAYIIDSNYYAAIKYPLHILKHSIRSIINLI